MDLEAQLKKAKLKKTGGSSSTPLEPLPPISYENIEIKSVVKVERQEGGNHKTQKFKNTHGTWLQIPDIGIGDKVLRFVCISDTHEKHENYLPYIPPGDILIHSGDIVNECLRSDFYSKLLTDFNNFLGKLPHTYKIYIAGNHDVKIDRDGMDSEKMKKIIPNGIYLQDSGILINQKIRIYGTPWYSGECSFETKWEWRKKMIYSITDPIDILITHQPPWNKLDLAWESGRQDEKSYLCKVCNKDHPRYRHWGCEELAKVLTTLKPKVHQFGHVHDAFGILSTESTTFINATMDLVKTPICFDYYYK